MKLFDLLASSQTPLTAADLAAQSGAAETLIGKSWRFQAREWQLIQTDD